METKAVSKTLYIVCDDTHCSDTCGWLIELSSNVAMPIEFAVCSLFEQVLEEDYRNDKNLRCKGCVDIMKRDTNEQ
jgi:hypothetical protein